MSLRQFTLWNLGKKECLFFTHPVLPNRYSTLFKLKPELTPQSYLSLNCWHDMTRHRPSLFDGWYRNSANGNRRYWNENPGRIYAKRVVTRFQSLLLLFRPFAGANMRRLVWSLSPPQKTRTHTWPSTWNKTVYYIIIIIKATLKDFI